MGLRPEGLATAFAAGLVGFASPCVLPLIPGYLSFVSGVGFDQLGSSQRRVVVSTSAFVAGFAVMFAVLGAGAGWFGTVLLENRRSLEVVAGAFLALAGLVVAGLRLPRALLIERHPNALRRPGGLGGAALTGVAFAIGWTPCTGPTLAAIFVLAGRGSPTDGAILLTVYALGLGVPFLLSGLFFTRALAASRWLRGHWRAVSLASGSLLVLFGVLLASGELVRLTTRLARFTGIQI